MKFLSRVHSKSLRLTLHVKNTSGRQDREKVNNFTKLVFPKYEELIHFHIPASNVLYILYNHFYYQHDWVGNGYLKGFANAFLVFLSCV